MSALGWLSCATETDTLSCAAKLAGMSRIGDIIGLSGPLGSGKTTFARGFVRARVGEVIDVPSPTFTLVQTYTTPTADVWHCDLYRLDRPQDGIELGLEEAFANAITLLEWPERLGTLLPQSRLMMTFSTSAADRHERRIEFDGSPVWAARLSSLNFKGSNR
jgi:tRNA threonylcarbamoyladenosine biosynthesis protein TsaE